MPIPVNGLTAEELHAALAPHGASLRVARQLQAAVFRQDALPERLENVKAGLFARVRAEVALPRLELLERRESPRDGFIKYLFRGAGAEPFETVRIPLAPKAGAAPRYVVCVSSQVGCPLGCAFCATGRLGWKRNLEAWEIVDQVARIRADSAQPVSGVVFMGMGEPLLNYDAVIRAARILSAPCGMAIAGKAVSISTAGIAPAIRRYTAERHPYRLILSLTSADPAVRRELMPVEGTYPTPELIEALRAHHAATGLRLTIAWIMISGVNTRPEDAHQLAELFRGLPITLDLIDVNDPSGRFRPPPPAELDAFRDALRATLAQPVVRRYSGGGDIAAACGMLAGRNT